LASGNNEFWFGEGILPNEISLRKRPYSSLLVTFKDGGSIEMEYLFSSDRNPMFRFSNGESWNISEIKRQTLLLSSTENNDTIQGFLDDDTINGYGGSDYIYASDGDDVLTGGAGSDLLAGEEGNDTYHYSLGDGTDTISGSIGIDRLVLGAGINEEDVNLQRVNGSSIIVTFRQGGSVLLDHMFLMGGYAGYENEGAFSNAAAIEKIIFNDGIEWDLDTIKEKLKPIASDSSDTLYGFESNDAIDGLEGNDDIRGLSGNDTLTGGVGNDTLYGDAGNDQLTGGAGLDYLYGGEGNDKYIVNAGEGYKLIRDYGGNDVLQFGAGINPEHLMVAKNGNNLYLYDRKGQFIVIEDNIAQQKIERVEFASGDIWDANIIQQKIASTKSLTNVVAQENASAEFFPVLTAGTHITGFDARYIYAGIGNDTLVSALTGDVIVAMKGGEGIDNFVINHGVRRILDFNYSSEVVVFSNVFSLDDLDFYVTNNYGYQNDYNPYSILHLKDKLGNATAQIGRSIIGYNDSYHGNQSYDFHPDSAALQFIVLADGNSYSLNDLLALKNKVTNGNDYIRLLSQDDIVDAGSGNDFVSGGDGKDTLNGGDGNDQIYGGQGNDQIDGGDHNDVLTGGYGDDYIAGGVGNDILDGGYGLDTLVGGAGDDLLYSRRYGDDLAGYDAERIKTTYIYRLGDGNDTIVDQDGDDKLIFGQGIAADDIEFEQIKGYFSSSDHLLIKIRQGGSILIQDGLSNEAPGYGFIEQIEFSGGLTWDKNTIAAKIWGTDNVPPPMPTAEFNSVGTIVIGYAEASSLVEVKSSNGVLLGGGTADSTTGAYTITLTTALINKEAVNVTAKDAAGNISAIKVIVAPDKTAPALPTASFDIAGKVIGGVAEAGSVIVVKDANNTSTLGTVTAHATTGAYSITLASALINKETVNITATDAAGNVSVARAVIAPDITASNTESIIIQAENYTSMSGVWNEPTTDVGGGQDTGNINTGDWMAYNNAAFSVPAEGRYTVTYRVASLNGGGRLALKELSNESTLGSIAIPKTGAWQSWVDVTQEITLSAGEHNFKIYAESGGFNVNWFKLEPVAATGPITPDTTPPAQPTAIFDSIGKVITGIAEAGSVVVVKNANNTSTLGTVTADATTGAYSITLVTALINKETINVTATDTAGNISAIRAIIAPDKTAPSAPTASFNATGKVITGVAEAGSTVSVKNAAGAELKTVTANATTGEYSITLTAALINKETVNITATDAAGNVSVARAVIAPDVTTPNPASIIIQAENYTSMSGVWNEPTTDVGGGQDTGNINTGDWMAYNNAAFSVPAEGRYKVTYRVASLNGGGRLALKELSNESTLGAIAIPKTGAWQSWVDVTQEITLSAGEHNFKIYAENGGFNVNWFKLEPVAATGPITPDTTPPAQPTAIFDSIGKVITGIAEAGSVVVVKNANNTSTLGTVTADATTGAYSITLATALINKETVNVTATDAAGNISAIKAIIAPDKTAPIAPTVTLDVTSKIVSGVAEAGSSVTVKDSTGQTLGVVQANATSGAYSVSFTQTLIHGQSIFTTATDGAGNISAVTATPIVINNTPIQAGNGLRGSYYGYHQPTNGNVDLTNLNQVLGLIGNRTPDATFIAKNIQYGRSGPTALGMGINLQNFLKTDAASLSRDPGDTSDAILRFDGKIQLSAGTYNFRVRADDGYSIKVNGMTVAEYALNQAATTRTHASFTIAQSGLQDFEIIYWDSGWDHILNVELANTATGNYAYISEGILFQPTPIEPIAMTSATHVLDADYGRVHYYNRNDALIQAMASFDPAAGMDTRYRAVSVDQHHLVLAVGS
jgi:Ca2+-binding RTX toxin-like protein